MKFRRLKAQRSIIVVYLLLVLLVIVSSLVSDTFLKPRNIANVFRQAAVYADRILHGANPGDLPISLPTKFELVVNLTTAKTLGVDLPMSLMIRADEMLD